MANIKIELRPWKPDDSGYACMPMLKNIPDPKAGGKHNDWKLTNCPSCGSECWESDHVRQIKAAGITALCTECALRAVIGSTPGTSIKH